MKQALFNLAIGMFLIVFAVNYAHYRFTPKSRYRPSMPSVIVNGFDFSTATEIKD